MPGQAWVVEGVAQSLSRAGDLDERGTVRTSAHARDLRASGDGVVDRLRSRRTGGQASQRVVGPSRDRSNRALFAATARGETRCCERTVVVSRGTDRDRHDPIGFESWCKLDPSESRRGRLGMRRLGIDRCRSDEERGARGREPARDRASRRFEPHAHATLYSTLCMTWKPKGLSTGSLTPPTGSANAAAS